MRSKIEIVNDIRVLETKLSKLIRKTNKNVLTTNFLKVQIINLKDKIKALHDELKEVAEKEKIKNE